MIGHTLCSTLSKLQGKTEGLTVLAPSVHGVGHNKAKSKVHPVV